MAQSTTGERDDLELALRLGAVLRLTFIGEGGSDYLRAIDESGLTTTQTKALLMLGEHGELAGCPLKTLAGQLGVSVGAASRAVDGLVRGGHVTRSEDAADRRVRRIGIAPSGSRLVDRLMAARIAGIEHFVAGLTPAERRKLDGALVTLLERPDVAGSYAALSRAGGRRR